MLQNTSVDTYAHLTFLLTLSFVMFRENFSCILGEQGKTVKYILSLSIVRRKFPIFETFSVLIPKIENEIILFHFYVELKHSYSNAASKKSEEKVFGQLI